MTLTMVHPGGAPNTFVPSTEATHNMIVDFSRNINSFKLNQYVYIVPVTKMKGIYTKMTVEEAGRLLSTDGREAFWPLGNDAPQFRGRTEKFDFPSYTTKRYADGFRIPKETAEQASWDIIAQHGRIVAQRSMTRRTEIVTTLLQTTGNWPTGNKAVVGSGDVPGTSAGQHWDDSTTARLTIKRSLVYGVQQVQKQTLGAVSPKDLKLVIGPDTAAGMVESQEIVDMIKQSPDAIRYLENDLGPNAYYGLPAKLYGIDLIVEDAVQVTSKKGASSTTKSFVWNGDYAALLYRAGGKGGQGDGLVGDVDSNAAPTFSTLTMFMYEEMTVENKYDTDNRVNKGRVVENYDTQITAEISGFLFSDVLA